MTLPMHARCPALIVAAPASGQGKTTVTSALARLHARQGRRVRVFKCGPDHLDPHWHELASGAPVHPLDLWLTGERDCRERLHRAACEADLILIEGVMGLFDGEPSVAELARRLGIPVLAVIDASAMGGTLGALAHGLRSYWPDLPWAGVLANRVAGARHADMLRAGLRDARDWLGALPAVVGPEGYGAGRRAALLPERQLGLVAARELPDALARLDAAADALQATPLGAMELADWQRWAVDFPAPAAEGVPAALLAGRRIAVAQDEAFCLVYPANLDALRQWGAQVILFSPLRGDALPECDALWLPGGYPELHVAALAAHTALREQLREHVAQGRPIWAEGGGMLALLESITSLDGSRAPLWGLLPGHATQHARLQALGPRELQLPDGAGDIAADIAAAGAPTAAGADAVAAGVVRIGAILTSDTNADERPAAGGAASAESEATAGIRMSGAQGGSTASEPATRQKCPPCDSAPALRGHSFHYSRTDSSAAVVAHAVRPGASASDAAAEPVYRHGSIHASYFHAWFPSAPQLVARLLGAA